MCWRINLKVNVSIAAVWKAILKSSMIAMKTFTSSLRKRCLRKLSKKCLTLKSPKPIQSTNLMAGALSSLSLSSLFVGYLISLRFLSHCYLCTSVFLRDPCYAKLKPQSSKPLVTIVFEPFLTLFYRVLA